jgi:putative colanic acid biosynthesis acetyltransferase WcaB
MNTKGLFFLVLFRTSSFFTQNKILKLIGIPIRIFYKIIINYILGIDIHDETIIGNNFQVYHGQGLIIHKDTIIGDNVTVRQNTTIGSSSKEGKAPVIGNFVNIGANCVIIGNIKIGDNSIIGAGSVVVKDVFENTTVVGNPARKI